MDACIYSFFLHSYDGCLGGALLVFSTEPDYINWLLPFGSISLFNLNSRLLLRIGQEFLARMDERNGRVLIVAACISTQVPVDPVILYCPKS